MSHWTIVQDYHAANAIECFEHNGVPVVIRRVGTYAEATDGQRSTRDCPHITINIGAGYPTQGDGGWNSTSSVVAVGERGEDGRSRTLQIPFAPTPRASEAQMVDEAKQMLDQALSSLRGLDAAYATASERCAGLAQYQEPLSRSGYEDACAAMGVSPLSDADCQSYGVRYGDFSFPEYAPEYIVLMSLSHSRLLTLDAEEAIKTTRPAAVNRAPQKQGQLWEPCQCGREPIYMPLHLCANCWPQA